MSLVLDASVALSWFFEDEAGDHKILHAVTERGAHAPSIWRLEVANAMQAAIRRKRFQPASRDAALAHLRALAINIDPHTDRLAWVEILQIAQTFDLTLYDATYLELARRLALPLATRDQALAGAARVSGVEVL